MTPRDRVYRTEAVVLRRQELGEADRLMTILTPGHGKLRVVAKGVRRLRSRKAGHLELFTRADLLLARGRELDIITQAEAADPFPGLRNDLVRLAHAAYAVELLDCLAVAEEENRPLYRLLVDTLERLSQGYEPGLVVRFFEVQLLELTGFQPQLFRCQGCGAETRPEEQYFSVEQGGVLCPRCGPTQRGARTISLGALKVLRHFQRNTFTAVEAMELSGRVQAELESLMEAYLTHVVERRLNTPGFIRRVRALLRDPGGPGLQPDPSHTRLA
jgi:DNA repair protein RecO (recombination protein O)